jgi:acetyl esterase
VAGDSAGGNLATLAAAALRHELTIAAQLLFYPVTDADMTRPSYTAHGTGLPLTREDMRWFFSHYAEPSQWHDARISPLRHGDLAGSPPALVVAAEYDVLHDEALAYVQALRDAGVDAEWRDVAGMAHGFARMVNLIDVAAQAVDEAGRTVGDWCEAAGRAR